MNIYGWHTTMRCRRRGRNDEELLNRRMISMLLHNICHTAAVTLATEATLPIRHNDALYLTGHV